MHLLQRTLGDNVKIAANRQIGEQIAAGTQTAVYTLMTPKR
jgi:hypothetical protein